MHFPDGIKPSGKIRNGQGRMCICRTIRITLLSKIPYFAKNCNDSGASLWLERNIVHFLRNPGIVSRK